MTDFRQNFLAESVNNLAILQKQLAENFTESLRREAFRTIHTIKGGVQTFGLQNAARLADELENSLSRGEKFDDKNLLIEGIEVLADSLRQSEPPSHEGFIEKLQNARQITALSNVLLTKIPPQAFKKFSSQERNETVNALRDGKNIYCAEVAFEVSDFAAGYYELRKILSESGEIIASLPGEKQKTPEKIGFRIFLASRETAESVQKSVKDFDAEIFSHASGAENAPDDLIKMLSQIAAHIENIAEKTGKEIRLTILSHDTVLSAEMTKAFFDILLHLVRNAVDHAIERTGVIEICLFEDREGFYLSIADDGKGVDLQKVRARAVAENLISDDDLLDEQQMLALVFASEFSTAETVTEISGRGVGLDAVKSAVEKMNGKISVRNRKTNGAVFEIFVPKD
jgi:chemotaxis protein histidine kinase CheA